MKKYISVLLSVVILFNFAPQVTANTAEKGIRLVKELFSVAFTYDNYFNVYERIYVYPHEDGVILRVSSSEDRTVTEYNAANGEIIFQLQNRSGTLFYFSEGLARISEKIDGVYKYGFVNHLGEMVVPFIYDYAEGFSDGLAAVIKDGKYGFIDKNGEVVIPFIYSPAGNFSGGIAEVRIDGERKIINKNNEFVSPDSAVAGDEKEDTGLTIIESYGSSRLVDEYGKTLFQYARDISFAQDTYGNIFIATVQGLDCTVYSYEKPTQTSEDDDIYHYKTENTENNEVTITKYTGTNKTVNIPTEINGLPVTTIGDYAFYHTECESIVVPNSVKTIKSGALASCFYLKSITLPEGLTEIADETFYACLSLETINIPESVTRIGLVAFYNCPALEEIKIPKSVTSIEREAFCDSGLNNIKLPENLATIGDFAFANCLGLTDITIPASVTNIGNSMFSGCKNLTEITVSPENDFYASKDGILFSKDFTELIKLPPTFTGEYKIPENIKLIAVGAFRSCEKLESVVIPSADVVFVGWNAYEYYQPTETIEKPFSIADAAFSGCTSLTNITIPEGYTNIGETAFYGCTGLKSITLPKSLQSISWGAFINCTSLKNITIPDSVNEIGTSAFSSCTSLENIILPKSLEVGENSAFANCTNLKTVVLPEGLKEISYGVFYGCESLDNVIIPQSVEIIRTHAFNNCINLYNVTIPEHTKYDLESTFESTPYLSLGSGFAFWKDGLCYLLKLETAKVIDSNKYLDIVTIPETIGGRTVTEIGEFAFSNCTSLKEITIPDSVTSIDSSVFLGCTNLEKITLPKNLIYISGGLFWDCKNLKEITIPESIEDIYEAAFLGCDSLEEIVIPDSVKTIGVSAFAGCTNLKSITLGKGIEFIDISAFNHVTTDAVYYVPTKEIGKLVLDSIDNYHETNVILESQIQLIVNYNGKGVLTNSNKPDLKSLLLMQKALDGKITLTEKQKETSDIDGDGKLTEKDITLLIQFLCGYDEATQYFVL
jgi:hypothetical protein